MIQTPYLFRIKKYKKGYVVEIRKPKWLFWYEYAPYLMYLGTNEPYYFEAHTTAIEALISSVRFDAYLSIEE